MGSSRSEPLWREYDAGEPPPAPGRIGPFQVEGELGRGSFGVVYRARQEHTERPVAVKVLRPRLDRGDALRRFKREATALAKFHHPGIAQVFEAGREDFGAGSQHYLAMELVDGPPLTRYAFDLELDVRRRAELLVELLDAVHYAHRKGVIHRDLKPSNVLVDDEGRPRVIDFGVARITHAQGDWSLQTEDGQLLGTLPYMSPEQVAGRPDEVDALSDVYSVGVVAFELFTGELPYETGGLSIVTAITEHEPRRLRALDPSLPEDVEAIVAKALEKEPGERYGSAEAMAADLRRFLADEPIAARQPSLGVQLRKLARRNPLFVRSVVVAALFLVVGLGGTSVGLIRAWRAERELDAQYEEAKAVALSMLEYYLDEVRPQIGSAEAQARLLGMLTPEIDVLLERETDDPALLTARARLLESQASLAYEAGERARADQLLEAAWGELEVAHAKAPLDVGVQRAQSLVQVRIGDLAKADDDLDRALELYDAALARDEALARLHPRNPRLSDDLCWSYGRVAHLLQRRGEDERARELYERGRELAIDLRAWDPEPLRARLALCATEPGLVQIALAAGEHERALELARANLEHTAALVEEEPHNVVFRNYHAGALSATSRALSKLGRDDEAGSYRDELLRERGMLARLQGGDAVETFVTSGVGLVRWHLARDDRERAERLARSLVGETERLAERLPPEQRHGIRARAYEQLALVLRGTEEGAAALAEARASYAAFASSGRARRRDLELHARFLKGVAGEPRSALELLDLTRDVLGPLSDYGEALRAALERQLGEGAPANPGAPRAGAAAGSSSGGSR